MFVPSMQRLRNILRTERYLPKEDITPWGLHIRAAARNNVYPFTHRTRLAVRNGIGPQRRSQTGQSNFSSILGGSLRE